MNGKQPPRDDSNMETVDEGQATTENEEQQVQDDVGEPDDMDVEQDGKRESEAEGQRQPVEDTGVDKYDDAMHSVKPKTGSVEAICLSFLC